MQGPKNKDDLRELLTSRQFPNDPKSQQLQTPSDRMREKALVFGETLFGLVPDSEYHQLVGNVLIDLVVLGEMKLCVLRDVKTEHAPLRELQPPDKTEHVDDATSYQSAGLESHDNAAALRAMSRAKAKPKK